MSAQQSHDYTMLMKRRISSILLVCSNYDAFALEEDGNIEEQIAREFAELSLSNAPSIIRAESTPEALAQMENGAGFDLVIAMYNVGEADVFSFSHRVKELSPETPLVLLTSFSREVYRLLGESDTSDIDHIFCWNNSTDLIIAIIKLIEDKANADRDILECGVRAILLVEDSVRYYSTYLPLLYKLVLQQNVESIRDALNEKQQVLRKRSRPKILMATCYEEAVELYGKYRGNMLGVISDVGFVVHKGDSSDAEKIDAGVDLCHLIREDNPTVPFLMQSSQESMRAVAAELGVGFVVKSSKTLTHEVTEYIGREFGFGDFIVTDPDTGEELERATDLYEFERALSRIPLDTYKRMAANNYISRWLFARGLFSIANYLLPIQVKDDDDAARIRVETVRKIHDYRIHQALGVIAVFNPDTYNDAMWFSRLGKGSMGGKARGLAFLNSILQKYSLYDKWEDVRVLIPRTLVITTEYFDKFILENGLQYVINSDTSDEDLLSEFVASTLPADMIRALKVFIHHVRKPLAIRSSSKLEDSYYQPFAGVYSTCMIPHVDNEDQQLRLLTKAIKSVYASVYFSSSRSYITASANVISEEKMAVVLQEICGHEEQGYFFPTLSGVARSFNFYPVGFEKPEEGICKLAFGLGKSVVDGEQVLRFSPKYPKHVLQTSTPELTVRDTQQAMYALNLKPEKFKTSVDDSVNLERIPIADCTRFRSFSKVVSTYDYENMRIVDSPFPKGPKFVTFAHMLKYGTFPLAEIVQSLLDMAHDEMKCGVEIEFAANLDRGDGLHSIFHVLQVRPVSLDSSVSEVDWRGIDTDGAVLSSRNALGIGWINDVTDIVYLKKDSFDVLKTVQMAAELREINARMQKEGRNYVLIGYGRWGSSIASLGVPVKWADISEAKAIVECCLDNFRIDPSQGSHFFQNLTSFNVGYINVNPFCSKDDFIDFDTLDAMPALFETEYIRQLRFGSALKICVDGRANRAVIKP